MTDTDLQVKFGAQTSELTTAFAGLKAQTEALAAQMRGLVAEMKAGAEAASSQLQGALKGVDVAAKDVGESVIKTTGAFEHGGAGLGFYVRELHALADEFGSGRIRQGEGTLANLALTFLQSNTALIPYAAGLAALAASLGYVGVNAYQAQAAVSNLRLDAAANGFQLAEAAAAQLRDTIERLAGVSAGDAERIAKPFMEMGNTGATIAEMLAPIMKQLAQEMGIDVGKAAEEVASRFADLDGAGLAYVNTSRALSQAEKEHIAQLVASGQRTQAYAAIIDLMSRSLQTLKHSTDTAAAAARDHAQALQIAASTGYSLEDAEKMVGRASEQAAQKIDQESGALTTLRTKLLDASTAADNFSAGMAAALKVDKVASGIKEANLEIKKLEAGLASAPDHASAATAEMARSLSIWREKLKDLQNQGTDPVVGEDRGQLAQFEAAQQLKAAQSRETQQQILKDQIAANQAELSDSRLTEKERQQLILETAQKQRQLYDEQTSAGTKSARDVLGAARQSIQQEIQMAEEAAQKKRKGYDDDLSHHRASPTAYLSEVKAALNQEIAAVQAAYAKELQLAGLTATQKTALRREEALTVAKINDQMVAEERKAADQAQAQWKKIGDGIAGLLDSQVDGLIRGTTSVAQAFDNMAASAIEDLIKIGIKLAAEAAAMEIMNVVTGGEFGGVGLLLGGLPSFDVGSWSVPRDTLAQIHAGEMIVPAAATPWAQSLMSGAASGGGGGGDTYHTWHVTSNARDPRDVAREVAALWDRNPSFRPRY
jgi:hypothetical protein